MTPNLTFLDLRGDIPRPMKSIPSATVLCLGNFDGVHRAHTALLQEGCRLAAQLPLEAHYAPIPREAEILCGVFCFFRPSSDFLVRESRRPPAHLTTLAEKLLLFRRAGVDFVCLGAFPDIQSMEPDEFLHMLCRECRCVGAVCGFNFRFGRHAAGNASAVEAFFGAAHTVIMPEMIHKGDTVSSSRIRMALLAGDAEEATRLLGRPYSLTAMVSHGKQLGRTIGFPTANQFFPAESLIPAHGVYVSLCHTPSGVFPGVSNIGTHPTVDAHARVNCETYLMGYNGDLYGHRMQTELLCRLRAEETFPDLDTLTAAIRRDASTALEYIRRNRLLSD